ncbi:hypothetical protein RHGRI_009439 [Rhododendron griersonianum]|uniref:Viral late gene transcription factor 3 zinc ribbon domain-containing protein n=1 Tax=Rhododendron griersonianum TaxID=479676 RepID=A0AAV6KFE1_9ERIC|nr:hypothetical protein RHGRI_009439 [Rhododendron griersonianum]
MHRTAPGSPDTFVVESCACRISLKISFAVGQKPERERMEGSICAGVLVSPCANTIFHSGRVVITEHSKSGIFNLVTRNPHKQNPFIIKTHRFKTLTTAAAFNDVSAAVDPAQAEISWQIVVGALAGVTPFVVAGIEFSKRIIAQRRCGVCGGSGLVLRDKKYYFRCPGCGGFLPWQSWKRFFSG